MYKKKCYGLLVTSLLVLCLGLFSTSYAMSKSDAFDYCRLNCGYSSYFNVNNDYDNGNTLLTYNSYLQYLDNQPQSCFIVRHNNGADYFDVLFKDDIVVNGNTYSMYQSTNRPGQTTKYWYSFNFYYNTTGLNGSAGNSLNNTFPSGGNSFYMLYKNGEIIAASFELPITSYFETNEDDLAIVNGVEYCCIKRNYSINQWKIGNTVNFSELDGFEFYFYDLVANVELGYVEGIRSINTIRGNNCLYFSKPNLYVNNRFIRYNNPYRLDVYTYKNGADNVDSYYFLFLPRNAVISNGVIVDYGSGDFNAQDATNAIIDDMSNTANLSGDLAAITSGEIYSKLGFKKYNTNWATFIWNMLLSLKNKLLLDNGPVTFTFPYMKTYITVSSADFTVPNGLIKGFVSTFLTFGLIVLIYQRITALYHRLEEGNVSEVLTWSDVDDETFLM